MHEYSVVSNLIELCEENAIKNKAKKITKVIVEIGERSGVEAHLLKSAFETFKEESEFCKTSEIEIRTQSVILHCKNCDKDFQSVGLNYAICPKCNGKLDIIAGLELNLMSLEME